MQTGCVNILRGERIMKYVLDVIFLLLLILFLFLGAKKGFFRSVIDLVGTIVALGAAVWLGAAAAEWVFDGMLREALTLQVAEALRNSPAGTAPEAVLSALPDVLAGALEHYGITTDTLNQAISQASGSAAEAAVSVIAPAVISMLKALFSLVLFIFLLVILRIISGIISRLLKLPVLKQLNKAMGALLGVVQALLVILLCCFCLELLSPAASPEIQSMAENSVVYQTYLQAWE